VGAAVVVGATVVVVVVGATVVVVVEAAVVVGLEVGALAGGVFVVVVTSAALDPQAPSVADRTIRRTTRYLIRLDFPSAV
jgi:hypothetical protein